MARKKTVSVSRARASRKNAELAPIIKRPDGYYWEPKPGGLRGPFDTREEAEIDRIAGVAEDGGGGEYEPGETLQEAEQEIGVSEWIDPDTGGPAEDNVPRIEDH
jgi:hypothetical protein